MIKFSIQKKKKGYYFVYNHPQTKKQVWKTLSTQDLSTAKLKADRFVFQLEKDLEGGILLSEMKDVWLKHNSKLSHWYIKDVEKHFQPFVEYFSDCQGKLLRIRHLYEYQTYLQNKLVKKTKNRLSPTTIAISFSTIKSVWNFNRKLGNIENDIFLNFKPPKRREKLLWLNISELLVLIETAGDNPLYQGFIELLIVTGMRIGELSNLKWENIYSDRIILENTKRGGDDTIKIRQEIRECLEKIHNSQRVHKTYLFSNSDGKRLSYDMCHRIVKNYLVKAGFPKHTPHSLRHSFATNLILKGIDIYRVKELMRHNSVTTTQRYIKFTGMDIGEVEARIIPKHSELEIEIIDWKGDKVKPVTTDGTIQIIQVPKSRK